MATPPFPSSRSRAASLQAAYLARRARNVLRHPWQLTLTAAFIFALVLGALLAVPRFSLSAPAAPQPSAPLGAVLMAAVVVAVAAALLLAFLREQQRPRIADLGEASRAAGAPALATVRAALPTAPYARPLRATLTIPDDPWRLVLGTVSITGDVAPVVLVTGDEPTAVAAAAAGLARAAAEEPRSTLLVDTDAATCGAAATLTLRPGPGVAEVVGQGLAWTDVLVTSDIGGEHLLDVVTAGEHWAPRAPRLSMQDHTELRRLAARYELTVMVLPDLAALSATPDRSLVGLRALLVAQRAVTSADALRARAAAVTAAGAQVLGVVLWDTDLPPRVPHVEIAAAAHRLAERVRLGAHDTSEFPIPS